MKNRTLWEMDNSLDDSIVQLDDSIDDVDAISEKKVLPSLVLASFMVYFVVAIVFFYEY